MIACIKFILWHQTWTLCKSSSIAGKTLSQCLSIIFIFTFASHYWHVFIYVYIHTILCEIKPNKNERERERKKGKKIGGENHFFRLVKYVCVYMCVFICTKEEKENEWRVLNYMYFNYIQRSSVFVCPHINSLPVLITVIHFFSCSTPTGT